MSENERLRSEIKRISKCLHYETDGKLGVIGSLFDAMHIADEALAAKPDVCVWDNIDRLVPIRSCRAHTRVKFSETLLFAVLDEAKRTDGILCPGCGRRIEVKE